ncbi:Eco57I restriction-modification methylase domain-containing protein [Dehalococcoidia bacterium]|nr:Eco57I restriction-modification methylase domain-containing protein [Dehalococcoidia bacterium]
MNKEQAKELIKDTFESPFDKEKFVVFIKNLLNRIEESPFIYRGNFIPDAFEQYISTLERIGKYTEDENEIDLLIVKLKRETSLERARTMQRNFIAWYLKGSRGGKLKDAALVVFVSPDKEDWRFSLVNMDYRFEEGQSGRVKVKEEFTPARRWSFLVGKNERSHTAQSRLVSILEDDEHNPTLAQLEEAFNIEPVTKEFFDKYRILLVRTVDALDRVAQAFLPVKKDFELKNINTVDFAKKLLGQIVFLYFLQKKGWFGVKRDAEWGTGAKDFLRRLFEKRYGVYKNFFNDILEPLFYEALARERDDDFYSRFNCKIPFLNGGLFEPIGGYDWVHTDILLPDELFSNRRRTPEGDIGDGILDVFDRFNFTVKEDEPLEKEVAIDPELLGKLYEKFNAIRPDNFYEYKKALVSGKRNLEKQFNKKFGVYYTPREIVHYMCQQSLINYLSCELEGKVNKEDIEKLIKYGEQFTENEAAVLEKGKETQTYKYHLPLSIRTNAKFIDDKLKDIKICDPAIGSGAFPVGMMHEIIKTRNVLSAFINGLERSIYNFKRECIESSLYGVDIDAGACEVARLRLWLSLIVDEEDIRKIKPLPNLDYKIVCGNSLLRVEKDLFNNELFNELEKLKPLYFNETNPTKKQEYKNQIEELISKITKGHKEFDFEVYFSEVFHHKGGFDVVIANPPYVRQEKIKDQKSLLSRAGYEVYNSTSDLYTYFYERSWNILKPDGFSCFISSNKWMRAKYGENLRRFFKKKTEVMNLIDFGGYPVFEATVDTNILLFKKKQPNKTHKIRFVNVTQAFLPVENDVISFLEENQSAILQEKLDDKCWTFADERILKLKEKIKKIGVPLKNWNVKINYGIKTGYNEAFIIDNKTKERLCREDSRNAEVLKPILRGRDIGKYYYRWAGLWLIKFESGWTNKYRGNRKSEEFFKSKYPAIYKYLISFASKSGKGKGLFNRDDQGDYWWELRDCTYYPEFEKEKIVWQEIVREPSFAYDSGEFYCEATSFLMTGNNLKYLIAVLNSEPGAFFFKQFYAGGGLGEEGYRYKKAFLERLPIPLVSSQNKDIAKELEALVNRILFLTQGNTGIPACGGTDTDKNVCATIKEYERQIDQLVYKLYNLTDEEIKVVEGDNYVKA